MSRQDTQAEEAIQEGREETRGRREATLHFSLGKERGKDKLGRSERGKRGRERGPKVERFKHNLKLQKEREGKKSKE